MAIDAEPLGQLTIEDSADAEANAQLDSIESPAEQHVSRAHDTRRRVMWPRSPVAVAIVAGAATMAALLLLAGWLAYDGHRHQQADRQRNLYIEVAKQGAINLTTINYAEVDKDVQRILDSSTGTFHADFQHRAQPFIDVVKQVQSVSTGTVTAAGLESQNADQAQVLVSVAVKTASAGAQQQAPRRWRMRITVERNNTDAKVSNVEFVP